MLLSRSIATGIVSTVAVALLGTTAPAYAKKPKASVTTGSSVSVASERTSTDLLFQKVTSRSHFMSEDVSIYPDGTVRRQQVSDYTLKEGTTMINRQKMFLIECSGCKQENLDFIVETKRDHAADNTPILVITDNPAITHVPGAAIVINKEVFEASSKRPAFSSSTGDNRKTPSN